MTARGIRDFNPGNMRPGLQKWLGEQTPDGNYCVFDTPEHGIRAMAKNLIGYQTKYGLRTIRGIITRYAPPSDNNDTAAYINAVSADVGIGIDVSTDLTDPSVLSSFVMAIIQHENGSQPYPADVIERACAAALA